MRCHVVPQQRGCLTTGVSQSAVGVSLRYCRLRDKTVTVLLSGALSDQASYEPPSSRRARRLTRLPPCHRRRASPSGGASERRTCTPGTEFLTKRRANV